MSLRSPEASEDGQGDESSPGHRHASAAAGKCGPRGGPPPSPRQHGAKTEALLDRGRPLKDLCAPAEYLTGLVSNKNSAPEMSHSVLFLRLCSTPDLHMNCASFSQRKKKQRRKTVFVLEGSFSSSPAFCSAVKSRCTTRALATTSGVTQCVSDSSRWIEPLRVTVGAAFFGGRESSEKCLPFSVSAQVGNLGLLFMLLFFIYAALGVELFGKLGQ